MYYRCSAARDCGCAFWDYGNICDYCHNSNCLSLVKSTEDNIKTLLCGNDTVIVTENVGEEMYVIRSRHIQDIFDDWNGDCDYVPQNDARVFFASWNGKPINPYEYTDFESLLTYLMRLQNG